VNVSVVLSPAELSARSLDGCIAVVIDVIRASTTIVAALVHGARCVIPALTEREALTLASAYSPSEVLLAGEKGGEKIEGFPFGNSPLELSSPVVSGKSVILTTTNGTRLLLKAREAGLITVCGFVNIRHIAEWVCRQARDVVVLCAGRSGTFSLEDAVCAGMLATLLLESDSIEDEDDAARAARFLYATYAGSLHRLREDSRLARALAGLGREEDLKACLSVDLYKAVPLFANGAITLESPMTE
jgi:2-phosphosulfolactate phosphatase